MWCMRDTDAVRFRQGVSELAPPHPQPPPLELVQLPSPSSLLLTRAPQVPACVEAIQPPGRCSLRWAAS